MQLYRLSWMFTDSAASLTVEKVCWLDKDLSVTVHPLRVQTLKKWTNRKKYRQQSGPDTVLYIIQYHHVHILGAIPKKLYASRILGKLEEWTSISYIERLEVEQTAKISNSFGSNRNYGRQYKILINSFYYFRKKEKYNCTSKLS